MRIQDSATKILAECLAGNWVKYRAVLCRERPEFQLTFPKMSNFWQGLGPESLLPPSRLPCPVSPRAKPLHGAGGTPGQNTLSNSKV